MATLPDPPARPMLSSPDAWDASDGFPEGTCGHEVLDEVLAFGRRFIAWPSNEAAVAWVAWVAHAHLLDSCDSTPRLAVVAPEKQSGKTRVLEVTETLVPRPMRAANTTTAVLFRLIGTDQRPTVLLDEADAIWAERGANEELRALLNAGHRRGSDVARMVGEGSRMKAARFQTFAAVALAGIGDLPGTLMDRSVVLRMKRRAPHEVVARWRFRDGNAEGHVLRDRLAAWADDVGELDMPDDVGDVEDRVADVWEPLFAVADAAGGSWPDAVRRACRVLTSGAPQETSLRLRLLSEVRDVWPAGASFLPTVDLLARLGALDESPWGADGPFGERGLTPRKLGSMLGQYGVRSVHSDDKAHRGYRRAHLDDPWSRYLPSGNPSHPSEPSGRHLPPPAPDLPHGAPEATTYPATHPVCSACSAPLAEADVMTGAELCGPCEATAGTTRLKVVEG